MLYWKTFLAMCFTTFAILLGCIAIAVLGIIGVIELGVGLWILVAIAIAAMMMASLICFWVLQVEIKERRLDRANRSDN